MILYLLYIENYNNLFFVSQAVKGEILLNKRKKRYNQEGHNEPYPLEVIENIQTKSTKL